MKKMNEITDHQALLAEWNDYVAELSEKHGDKKKKKKKKDIHIKPDQVDPNIEGLRVQKDREEATVADVDPEKNVVTLTGPQNDIETMSTTKFSRKYKLG